VRKIIFIFVSLNLLFSCTSNYESKNLNIQKGKLAHTKFSNINNNLSYKEYKSLIVEYGKNTEFPDLN